MIERGQHLRFPLKAREALRVLDEGVGEDLQRDIAVELRVTGLVHLSHPACPELLGDDVLSELGT